MSKKPVRVAVTGAAGQIGYAILFRIAPSRTHEFERTLRLAEDLVRHMLLRQDD